MPMVDLSRSALLLLHLQNEIVPNFSDGGRVVERASEVLAAARYVRVPVAHVRIAFRENHDEIGPRSPVYNRLRESGQFLIRNEASEIHPAVVPEPNEVVILNKRNGAFAGSDVDVWLQGHRISTLVLLGIQTSGTVLSTIRHAADLDYRIVVISDACTDADSEVHRVLMEKVFPLQAKVVTAAQFVGLSAMP